MAEENQVYNNYETDHYCVKLGTMVLLSETKEFERSLPCFQIINKQTQYVELETVVEAQAIQHLIDLETALLTHREKLQNFLRDLRNNAAGGGKIVYLSPDTKLN
jgi:hypothetical protein